MSDPATNQEETSDTGARGAGAVIKRCGRWLWDALELSPEAMLYADPLGMSPALALFALEAEAQMRALDSGVYPIEPRRPRPAPGER